MSSKVEVPEERRVYALVDCNNFFASCERLFRPELQKRPVAVLSNNDGCVVARSNEVKALGVPMAAPHFKYKDLFEAHNVAKFSANFQLYGDISERVVQTLNSACPFTEVYSIDESFMELTHMAISDYTIWARQLAARVEKEVGVPVSIGVGPSKTLAKLATHLAKKSPDYRGGLSIGLSSQISRSDLQRPQEKPEQLEQLRPYLRQVPLGDVWGIGRRLTARLQRVGLNTAWDLVGLRDSWVLDNLTISGLRTVRELRGDSCKELNQHEDVNNQQKTLSVTRSFGHTVRAQAEVEAAIASLTARAAMRLRRKDQVAWAGVVFIRRKLPDRRHKYIYTNFRLPVPTSFTGDLIKGSIEALNKVYDEDFKYNKAGVIYTELTDEKDQQMSLFGGAQQAQQMAERTELMKAMDNLSLRYGKNPVMFAAEGLKTGAWRSKQEQISPRYTTIWRDIPLVKQI